MKKGGSHKALLAMDNTHMTVLFECRAIPTNKSCGIENYTYSVVKSIARHYPEMTLYCSVAAWEYNEYANLLNVEQLKNIKIVFDPLQRKIYVLSRRFYLFRVMVYFLRRLLPSFN